MEDSPVFRPCDQAQTTIPKTGVEQALDHTTAYCRMELLKHGVSSYTLDCLSAREVRMLRAVQRELLQALEQVIYHCLQELVEHGVPSRALDGLDPKKVHTLLRDVRSEVLLASEHVKAEPISLEFFHVIEAEARRIFGLSKGSESDMY